MIKSPEHGFFICHTDDYYNDFDEYFQNYVVNDGDLQGDEFVYPAKPVEIKLDAAEIINDWEESCRLEFDGDLIDKDQINELQSILDAWCAKQPSKCYVGDMSTEIPVPWCGWFGVQERGNSNDQ